MMPTIEETAFALLEATSADDVARTLLDASLSRSRGDFGAVLLGAPHALTPVVQRSTGSNSIRLPAGNAFPPGLASAASALLLSDAKAAIVMTMPTSAFDREYGPVPTIVIPLCHRRETLGTLLIEKHIPDAVFDPQTIGVLSMFAKQAAASLSNLRLSQDLSDEAARRQDAEDNQRAIYDSMIKHQRIGKMGDFRFNTRTLRSKGSPQCYTIFGYEPATDVVEYDLWMAKLHPDDRQRVHDEMAAAFAKRVPLRFEYRVVTDGQTRHILSEGHPEYDRNGDLLYCGVVVDITEQKAVEEMFTNMRNELTAAMRLASIGELAGSVVHEINQPLTAMIANADACRRWLAHEPANLEEAQDAADQVSHEGRRAAAVISGLEALAKGVRIRFAPVRINELVAEVLFLVKSQLERSRVSVTAELEKTVPEVAGDAIQLQQVVFNVIRNAVDAMVVVQDRPRLLRVTTWFSRREITVSFRDSGVGIEPERLQQIFDPLFTTKGDGLGLGLSICQRILSAHRGRIWAERNNDDGLTVSFALPVGVMQPERPLDPSSTITQIRSSIPPSE